MRQESEGLVLWCACVNECEQDALKIAKSMSEHKDPVYKAPKKEAHHHDKSSHKQASKHAKPTIEYVAPFCCYLDSACLRARVCG